MATIAILKSLHTLDNRQFVKGLSDSERRSRRAGQKIGRQARAMSRRFHTLTGNVISLRGAIGVLAGSAGIGILVSKQMKAIDSSAKLADRLNLQTQELTALQRLTELNGESTERLDDSLEAMSRRVGQAAEGFGQAERALEQLNLSAEELNDMGMAQQFETISNALQNVENANTRASIAADLFSRQGIGLLNTMDALANQGLQPTIDRLEKTGEAFDEVDAAKVEAANDAITQMKGAFTGMARIVTIELANPIKAVADSVDDAMTGSTEAQEAIRSMTRSAVEGMARVLEGAATVADFIGQNAQMVQFGLVGYVLFGKRGALIGTMVSTLFQAVELSLAKMGATTTEAQQRFVNLRGELSRAEEHLEGLQNKTEEQRRLMDVGSPGNFERSLERAKEEVERLEAEMAQVRESMGSKELEDFEDRFGQVEESSNNIAKAMRSVAESMREGLQGGSVGGGPNAQAGGHVPGGDGGGDSVNEMERQQRRLDVIRDSIATEMELEQRRFEQRREFLQTAHEELFESEQQRKDALLELERQHEKRKFEIQTRNMGALFSQQMQFLDSIERAQKASGATQVGIMANAFAQITAAGAQHSKKQFELNKAAGIASAIVSTQIAAAKALEQGPYIGPALAAMVTAAGMAKVQAIRSQSFQGGGGAAPSTSAGGGVPAVQNVGGGQQQQPQGPRQDITVQFVGSETSKKDMRRFIEQMREEAGDDATLGSISMN